MNNRIERALELSKEADEIDTQIKTLLLRQADIVTELTKLRMENLAEGK
jgi:hypothetical protein